MKLLWILPCLAVCACVQPYNDAPVSTAAIDNPYQESYAPVPAPAPVPANPYALKPAVYEDNNFAVNQKTEELMQKERDLLSAQQELYDREKKLAGLEADFINRSKALDYKETRMQAQPKPQPKPQPLPVLVPQPAVPYPSVPPTSDVIYEDTLVYSSSVAESTPAAPLPVVEDTQPGFIILQHPIQRDLVRCPATDDVCLQSYERLGYVRSSNLSRFTAQDELNNAGTYPANASGQWRENNSIPRW